jgi:TonB family protein
MHSRDWAVSWANYLNGMHSRIHPLFSDQFLTSLDSLGVNDPLNNPSLSASLDVALEPGTGAVAAVSVARTSGIERFDQGALDAVRSAAPFGPTPPTIVDSDNLARVTWEFRRDPQRGCVTTQAIPRSP